MHNTNKKISRKASWLHTVIFFAYFISYLYLLVQYSMSSNEAKYRYVILALCIIFEGVLLIKNYGLKFIKKTKHKSFLFIPLLGILFYIQSIILASASHEALPDRVLPQIFLVIAPPTFAYLLLNNTDKETIVGIFKKALLVSVIGYLLEPGHTLIDFFNFQNYSTLFSTNSFIESSIFSEIFLQLFFLFNYYTYISSNEKKLPKLYIIVAGFFTILCNKRLALAIVLLTPLTNLIIKKIKNKISGIPAIICLTTIFTILTIVYFGMLEHRLFPNIDIYKLSTGRDYILSLWEKRNYLSLGYGSSMILIGRYLELDLIEIYLELGLISLVLFCLSFLNTAKKSTYGLYIMTCCLFGMLTASNLPYSAGLILMFTSIGMIESNERDKHEA